MVATRPLQISTLGSGPLSFFSRFCSPVFVVLDSRLLYVPAVPAANEPAANVPAANVQDANVPDANAPVANVQDANVRDAFMGGGGWGREGRKQKPG